jgi:hypothetical protein
MTRVRRGWPPGVHVTCAARASAAGEFAYGPFRGRRLTAFDLASDSSVTSRSYRLFWTCTSGDGRFTRSATSTLSGDRIIAPWRLCRFCSRRKIAPPCPVARDSKDTISRWGRVCSWSNLVNILWTRKYLNLSAALDENLKHQSPGILSIFLSFAKTTTLESALWPAIS